MSSEKSGRYRPLFLIPSKRNVIPALIELVRRSRRLLLPGLWLAGNRPLFLGVVVSAAQETDLGRDHLDGGARVAVFVFVLADLEAAFDIHAISTGQMLGTCLPIPLNAATRNQVVRSWGSPSRFFHRSLTATEKLTT
jgi:hypothetical protein